MRRLYLGSTTTGQELEFAVDNRGLEGRGMKRLRQAAAYLAASALLIWLNGFHRRGLSDAALRRAGPSWRGTTCLSPRWNCWRTTGRKGASRAVGPGYFVRVYLRHRLGPLWGHGGSVFYSADESLVAEVFAPGELVMGACDVPGAAEVSFELLPARG